VAGAVGAEAGEGIAAMLSIEAETARSAIVNPRSFTPATLAELAEARKNS
jgi:hypothetical protein